VEGLKPFSVQLNGSTKRRHLVGDFPKTIGLRSGEVLLDPGESVGQHSTKAKEEIIVIFSGKAEIFSDKIPLLTVQKDSLVYIPPHTDHNVKNVGNDVLRYIYVVSPVEAKK